MPLTEVIGQISMRTVIANTDNSIIYSWDDGGEELVIKMYGVTSTDVTHDVSSEFMSAALINAIKDTRDKLVAPKRIYRTTKRCRLTVAYDVDGMIPSYFCSVMDRMKTDLGKIRVKGEKMMNMLYDMVECVAHLHESNIIHGDIKPANFLLNQDGIVMLCDIGSCFPLFHTTTNYTRLFRAPETYLGVMNCNRATDIWALGASMYEMITDEPLPIGDSDAEDALKFISAYGDIDNLADKAKEIDSSVYAMIDLSRGYPVNMDIRTRLDENLEDDYKFMVDLCMECLNPIPELRLDDAQKILKIFDPDVKIDVMKIPSAEKLRFNISSVSNLDPSFLLSFKVDNNVTKLTEILYSIIVTDSVLSPEATYIACLMCCNGSHPTSFIDYSLIFGRFTKDEFDLLLVEVSNIISRLLSNHENLTTSLFHKIEEKSV